MPSVMALSDTLRSKIMRRASFAKQASRFSLPGDSRRSRKNKENEKKPAKVRFLAKRRRLRKRSCNSSSSGVVALDLVKPKLKRNKSNEDVRFVRSSLRLREIMRNEECLSAFLCFCQSQYNAENLLFWLNAENFRLLADEGEAKRLGVPLTHDQILNQAVELYNRFIKQDAIEWVCLQTETTSEITNRLLEDPASVSATLFNRAQEETLQTVENDIIPRFIQSAVFTEKFKIEDLIKDELRQLLLKENSHASPTIC